MYPDNATYDAVPADDTLLLVVPPDGPAKALPVFTLMEIERRPSGFPLLRLRRPLLRNDTPGGRARTSRLLDALNRAMGRYADDAVTPYAFRVIYRAVQLGKQVPVLAYDLTACAYAGDRLVVAAGSGMVEDEVLFSVGKLTPIDPATLVTEPE